MTLTDDILTNDEQIILKLRSLYKSHGYAPFKVSCFEPYELYAANRAFLPGGDIIAFTDGSGNLMALRPDVTLSIVKSIKEDKVVQKLYYNENVYRTVDGELKEQMQVGLECIGNISTKQVADVIILAKKSLDVFGKNARLDISHMGFLSGLLNSENLTASQKADITKCISRKNISEIKHICKNNEVSDSFFDKISSLISLHGSVDEVMPALEQININSDTDNAINELRELNNALAASGIISHICIDFSAASDITYYNGIIYQGFIEGVPEKVLSGGRYDKLLRNFGHGGGAIGFAVYLNPASSDTSAGSTLGVALPKGRLGEKALELFARAGYECPDIQDAGRKLVFEDSSCNIRFFWVKPSDVAVYVRRGAADVGIIGKDTLLEDNSDVYELLDLKIGICRMCVAAKSGFAYDNHKKKLKVATKFPNITRSFFAGRGNDVDIIKLHGSIELAPLLGLSDIIVDLVETGKTLADNGMDIVDTITDISARLISNKASYKFNHDRINKLCNEIAQQL